jgi:cyclic beta-1,2-glucan synthetase
MAGEHSLWLYLGGIALITAFLTTCLLMQAAGLELSSAWPTQAAYWVLLPIAAIALPGTSQLAVAMINWLATLLVSPHPLPRMDFSAGIPPAASALVVIPTMLTSAANIDAVIEALEVRFLANRDENLFFGLLTDFLDSPEEFRADEELLLEQAGNCIKDLNRKYGAAAGREPADIFFLFHRARGGARSSQSGWATSASAASWRN